MYSQNFAPSENTPLIFWDGYGLQNPYSGVFHHAKHLCNALKNIEIEPKIIVAKLPERIPLGGKENIIEIGTGRFTPLTMSKLIWPIRVENWILKNNHGNKTRPKIIHGLSNLNLNIVGSDQKSLKKIITIHDLTPLIWPNQVSFSYYLQFKFALNRVVNKADWVITVSEWTKQTISHFFPQAEGKTSVIPNGYDSGFGLKKAEDVSVKERPDKEPQILFISRFEKYKRFSLLVEIIKKMQDKFRFIIVTDEKGEAFIRRNLSTFSGVRIKKNLDEREIDKAYSESDVLLVTSLSEGFCLPASQAASLGMPVVYTRGSAIDEVINPENSIGINKTETANKWIEALEHIKNSPVLAKETVELFLNTKTSWADAAKKVKLIYNEISA